MIEPDMRLQNPLESYVEYFEKLNRRSIALLEEMAVPSLYFQDPYHKVQGTEKATALLRRRFDVYPTARYGIRDFTWARRNATAYIHWDFLYSPGKTILSKNAPENLSLEGVSEIVFSPDGKIMSHTEYWAVHVQFNIKAYGKPL